MISVMTFRAAVSSISVMASVMVISVVVMMTRRVMIVILARILAFTRR